MDNSIVIKSYVGVGVAKAIIHANFSDLSVWDFFGERGSNFILFHCLALSSLKHSGTTVPECDKTTNVLCRRGVHPKAYLINLHTEKLPPLRTFEDRKAFIFSRGRGTLPQTCPLPLPPGPAGGSTPRPRICPLCARY